MAWYSFAWWVRANGRWTMCLKPFIGFEDWRGDAWWAISHCCCCLLVELMYIKLLLLLPLLLIVQVFFPCVFSWIKWIHYNNDDSGSFGPSLMKKDMEMEEAIILSLSNSTNFKLLAHWNLFSFSICELTQYTCKNYNWRTRLNETLAPSGRPPWETVDTDSY